MVALVGLALTTTPAQSQSPWFAYLYSGADKTLVRLDQTGQQTLYSLGLASNEYTSVYNMSFSADGSRVGFCTMAFGAGDQLGTATAYVRDIQAQTSLLAVNLGQTMSCQSSRQSLSPDGTLLAVSLTNYYISDSQADTSRPAWQLLVLDAATGSVVHELNADSASAPPAESDFSLISDVRYFDPIQIIFAAIPYGTEDSSPTPAYLWQFSSDTVTPLDDWGNEGTVFIQQTGEVAWIANDPTLAAASPNGPIPPTNVVMLADKNGQARRIYHSPDWLIAGLHFVNSGRGLAVLLSSPFDPNQPDNPLFFKWALLDRSGAVSDIRDNMVYADIGDAPDGYALFWEDDAAGDPAQPVYHLALNGAEIWTLENVTAATSWQLAWTLPSATAPDLTPFATSGG